MIDIIEIADSNIIQMGGDHHKAYTRIAFNDDYDDFCLWVNELNNIYITSTDKRTLTLICSEERFSKL